MPNNGVSISLKEHIEKIFDLKVDNLRHDLDMRFADLKEAITEARRIMENRMEGFPAVFAKRGELDQTANIVKELKERDIRDLKDDIDGKMSRIDYEFHHKSLLEKMDVQEKRIQNVELLKADVSGRVWTLGFALSAFIVIVGLILHYWGKG